MTKRWTLTTVRCIAIALAVSNAPLTAFADPQATEEQKAACTGDVMRFCFTALPNATRIVACLSNNKPQLSPACRALFNKS